MSRTIYHLLKKGEFRVWCVPNRAPGPAMDVTMYPSKATCVNCLTNFRYATRGQAKRGYGTFRRAWTDNHNPPERTPREVRDE